jgi:hypothetical protein
VNIDPDLVFVVGIIVGVAAFPALLNSFTHGRAPKLTALLFLASFTMITYSVVQRPSGYAVAELPGVFKRVLTQTVN